MNTLVNWIFFCSEADYPKFLALVPEYPLFRPTYDAFKRITEERINRDEQQVTRKKVSVCYDDFFAYYSRPENKGKNSVWLIEMFTHLSNK